jgi:hypothetical protein
VDFSSVTNENFDENSDRQTKQQIPTNTQIIACWYITYIRQNEEKKKKKGRISFPRLEGLASSALFSRKKHSSSALFKRKKKLSRATSAEAWRRHGGGGSISGSGSSAKHGGGAHCDGGSALAAASGAVAAARQCNVGVGGSPPAQQLCRLRFKLVELQPCAFG